MMSDIRPPRYRSLSEIVCAAADVLRPAERLTVSQAAAKYRKLHNPGAYSGDWKNEKVPYMIEPQDVLTSRDYNACVFVGGAQLGKTDALLLNWLTYSVVCDPMDMMLVNTAQATARDFSIRRVDRLHRHSPKVGELALKGNKDNVFDKHYRSGMMLSLSWPSINELSGRPVPRVALTDLDRMPENVDGEGSPFDLARKRTTTFGSSAMTLAESSPGHEVQDPRWIPSSPHEAPPCPGILALYNRGDRRRWFWPCPFCNEFFEPSFKLLQWDNTIDIVAAAESVRMICPACRKPIEHYRKEDMNLAGQWVKEGEFIDCDGRITGNPVRSDIATFWLKGPAAAFITWQKMVLNYLLAEQEYERTGSQEALKSTVNTDQGEPYYPRGTESMRAPEEMKDRAVQAPTAQEGDKNRPLVPHGVRFLIAQVDVQANRWEVQVHGIIPNGTLYDIQVIDRFPIIKSARIDERTQEHAWVKPGTYLEDWDLVRDEVILREYELEDGSGFMAIKLVVCDSGGKEGTTANAYNFWRKLRREGLHHRFLLLKGEVKPGIPRIRIEYPDSGDKRGKEANARGEIPVLFINTNLIKDELNGRLDREDEGGGAILYPDWLEDDWFVELTGERRTDKGWVKLGSKRRNEAWDLLVYAIATCLHLGLERWDWTSVPGWAAEWPENTLVRAPEQGARFTPVETGTYDAFGRLGAALG